MNNSITIQAWRDPFFRQSLDPSVLIQLPSSPAGVVEILKFHRRFATTSTNTGISNSCGGDCSASAGNGICCGDLYRKPSKPSIPN
jgi:mersacidin/lichenicidin family type 2 lantibiotic